MMHPRVLLQWVSFVLLTSACDAKPVVVIGTAKQSAPTHAEQGGGVAGRTPDLGSAGAGEPDDGACDDDDSQAVCGSDGVTYRNACQAAAAHVSVAHRGAC